MLAAGVPLRLLVPDAWGDLASGLEQGVSALPGLNVPYRGVDEWVRTVLLAGRRADRARRRLAGVRPARAGRARRRRSLPRRAGRPLRGADRRARAGAPVPRGRRALAAARRCCCGASGSSPGRPGSPPSWRWRRRRSRSPSALASRGPLRCSTTARSPQPRGRRLDRVRLEPRLRAAGLAARRARGAARPGADGRVLEGDDAGDLRRRALARTGRRPAAWRATASSARARARGSRRSASWCATCARTSSSARGRPMRSSTRRAP